MAGFTTNTHKMMVHSFGYIVISKIFETFQVDIYKVSQKSATTKLNFYALTHTCILWIHSGISKVLRQKKP